MSRINTNVPSLVARANLARSGQELEIRLNRLSTGLRISRGADDPAGLIVSERLRSDLRGNDQGIKNSERASSVIATTEGSLAEVSDLLNSIRALIVEAANTGATSPEERRANQMQIDSAIDSITRIANTTSFGGLKLLNGSLDYTLSGVAAGEIAKTQIFGASFIGTNNLLVEVDVLASAQPGMLFVRGDYAGFPGANGTLLSSQSLEIQGARGVSEISFTSGQSLTAMRDAVNSRTSITGVKARLVNDNPNSGLIFESDGYGSNAFVSVRRLNAGAADTTWQTYHMGGGANFPGFGPPFDWDGHIGSGLLSDAFRDVGRDVTALINGTLATGEGLSVSVNAPSLSLGLLLTEQFATDPVQGASTFHITGGGALFQLGPQVTAQQQTNIGIQSIAASSLGGTLVGGSLQFLSSLKSGQENSIAESHKRNNYAGASEILDSSIDEVAVMRGRLGAFERNVLQTNVRSLQAAFENISASESKIRDADFAAETSHLTRAQILQAAGTTVLSLANQSSQQVLQLLG